MNAKMPSMILPWMKNGSVRQFLCDIVEGGQYDPQELSIKVDKWVGHLRSHIFSGTD